MSSPPRKAPRAVLLDAMGTLVSIEPPGPRLRAELRRGLGIDVGAEAADAAFAAEIRFYLEHHLQGRDEHSLSKLRDRCAGVIASVLGLEGVGLDTVRTAMLASLRFRPQPDALAALRALRRRGARLAVASNWDCSLADALREAGLAGMLDAVVSSAQAGAAKPDPAVLEAALAAVGVDPREAVHVGDSVDHDVAAARRAGVRAILLDRGGEARGAGVPVIRTLGELASLPLQDR